MSSEARDWPAERGQLVVGVPPPGFTPVTGQALSDIVQRVVSELRPEKIIVFGSYGYGSPSENSDVDLLVIMKTSKGTPDYVPYNLLDWQPLSPEEAVLSCAESLINQQIV